MFKIWYSPADNACRSPVVAEAWCSVQLIWKGNDLSHRSVTISWGGTASSSYQGTYSTPYVVFLLETILYKFCRKWTIMHCDICSSKSNQIYFLFFWDLLYWRICKPKNKSNVFQLTSPCLCGGCIRFVPGFRLLSLYRMTTVCAALYKIQRQYCYNSRQEVMKTAGENLR